jgi:glycosyltransferase involved in cell wall biosynthesis
MCSLRSVGNELTVKELLRSDRHAFVHAFDEKPLVTVFVPVFNGMPILEQTLAALREQTYRRFQAIIVDDASTDRSWEFLSTLADVRFIILRNEKKLGMVRNWNRALDLVHTPYLAFVFQDDPPKPAYLEEIMHMALARPEVGLVFCRRDVVALDSAVDARLIRGVEDVHLNWTALAPFNTPAMMLDTFFSPSAKYPEAGSGHNKSEYRLIRNRIGEPSCVLMKTACFRSVGAFDCSFRQLADWELWLRILQRFPVAFCDQALARFSLHAENATARNLGDRHSRWRSVGLDGVRLAGKALCDPLYEPLRNRFRGRLEKGLRRLVQREIIGRPLELARTGDPEGRLTAAVQSEVRMFLESAPAPVRRALKLGGPLR